LTIIKNGKHGLVTFFLHVESHKYPPGYSV
jgi:hypothetical protein